MNDIATATSSLKDRAVTFKLKNKVGCPNSRKKNA